MSSTGNSKFFLLVGIVACTGAVIFAVGNYFKTREGPCVFCDRTILDKQKFYEDDLVLGLVTHKPIFPGHVLIISKRHVEHFEQLTAQEIDRIGTVIKRVHDVSSRAYAASSYMLLQKNGMSAGQTVPHMHIHYIPCKGKETPGLGFLLRFFFIPMLPAISDQKIREVVTKMRMDSPITLSDTAAYAP